VDSVVVESAALVSRSCLLSGRVEGGWRGILISNDGVQINPFLNETVSMSGVEWIKLVVLGFTLAPIRLLFTVLVLVTIWLLMRVRSRLCHRLCQ
jgi:hypothetical protein